MSSNWQSKGWGLAESYDRKASEAREPVKFEAGQVVRASGGGLSAETLLLVRYVDPERMLCDDLTFGGAGIGFYREQCDIRVQPVSPAPRIGDTWSSGESVARIVDCADRFIEGRAIQQLRIVSEGDPFVGDVVVVARRLWEGGYRRVERESLAKRIEGAARVTAVVVNGKTIPLNSSNISSGPSYLTLDDLKALVPTHGEAKRGLSFEEMFARDPIAQAFVEQAQRDMERRAKEMFPDRSTDDAAAVQFHVSAPYPRSTAERGSFTVELPPLAPGSYTLSMDPATRTATLRDADGALLPGITPIERTRDGGHSVGRDDAARPDYKWHTVHDDRIGCTRQTRVDPFCDIGGHIQRVLDSTRVDRATGDDLRKLAELHGVPELRAGMVVRQSLLGHARFGCVSNIGPETMCIRWGGDREGAEYSAGTAAIMFRRNAWRIVTPDVAPLASLAYAVAAIAAYQIGVATSRRHIDAAIASLGGEPFARAIAAALVAASDAPLTAHQIASLVAGARAHERRRGEVAPARRELTDGQITACWAAAHYESNGQWSERLSRVYERARAL